MNDAEILIIGGRGQLGLALQAQYPNATAIDSDELDITSSDAVQKYNWKPFKCILNAAAYTNVDGAETAEGRVAAWKVNAQALRHLCHIAWQNNIAIVHISTDYVFDGLSVLHTEDEPFCPLSVYGASKAAGDLLVAQLDQHYIVRTSWVIGEGKNFIRTMLGLGQKGISPSVVSDQIGRLTFTNELVRAIDHLLVNQAPFGTYNVSNQGESVSWADITRKTFALAGYNDLTVTDTTTEEYYRGKPGIAPRPLQSTLDLTRIQATGFKNRDWQDDLKEYIQKEMTQ